jgi:hypothetical protein
VLDSLQTLEIKHTVHSDAAYMPGLLLAIRKVVRLRVSEVLQHRNDVHCSPLLIVLHSTCLDVSGLVLPSFVSWNQSVMVAKDHMAGRQTNTGGRFLYGYGLGPPHLGFPALCSPWCMAWRKSCEDSHVHPTFGGNLVTEISKCYSTAWVTVRQAS